MTFQVCLVTKEESGSYPALEEACKHLGVELTQREYDSWTHFDDREFILSLPAFHVYEHGHRVGTYYPGIDVMELERLVYQYRKRGGTRKKKSSSWRRLFALSD
jgi:hypothetical protein